MVRTVLIVLISGVLIASLMGNAYLFVQSVRQQSDLDQATFLMQLQQGLLEACHEDDLRL